MDWGLFAAIFFALLAHTLIVEILSFFVHYTAAKWQAQQYMALQGELDKAFPNGLPPELLQFGGYPSLKVPDPKTDASGENTPGQYL